MIDIDDFMQQIVREYYYNNMVEPPKLLQNHKLAFEYINGGYNHKIYAHNKQELIPMILCERPISINFNPARYIIWGENADIQETISYGDIILDIDQRNMSKTTHHDKKEIILPCDRCLENGRESVHKIYDVLRSLNLEDYSKLYWSGNDGYHIHINTFDTEWAELNYKARRKLGIYISKQSGVLIDMGVVGSKHLVRMIGSLNSKTGLPKTHIQYKKRLRYDPYNTNIHDNNTQYNNLHIMKPFRSFGFQNEIITYEEVLSNVSRTLAIYMIRKGLVKGMEKCLNTEPNNKQYNTNYELLKYGR